MINKYKIYNSIMESVSKELQNILQFNNSNIFNTEESQYNYNEKDSLIYRNIENKIQNDILLTDEEAKYYIKANNGISECLLDKLLNGNKVSNNLIN